MSVPNLFGLMTRPLRLVFSEDSSPVPVTFSATFAFLADFASSLSEILADLLTAAGGVSTAATALRLEAGRTSGLGVSFGVSALKAFGVSVLAAFGVSVLVPTAF